MVWKPINEYPKKDGAYFVRLHNGTEQKAWFILRKGLWMTMDGSECINIAVKEWRTGRLEKPYWEKATSNGR